MGTRMRAISLLALGLGLGGLSQDAQAAPSTPPPPPTNRATPPPPSAGGGGNNSPFLPTSRPSSQPPTGGATSPPPPASAPPLNADAGEPLPGPEEPPQDLSDTWGFSRKSSGVTPRYVRSSDPTYAAPNPVGFYSGVSVQGNQVPPFPAKKKGTKPALMTWTGFERSPEGSRVFFQLSAEADYKVDRKEQTLQIRMRNTKVNVRNNLRYLDLRYFDTPVRTVKVRRKGRDTVATIVLKRADEPTVKFVEGKAGYKLLVVQFSDAGGAAAEPPPPPPR